MTKVKAFFLFVTTGDEDGGGKATILVVEVVVVRLHNRVHAWKEMGLNCVIKVIYNGIGVVHSTIFPISGSVTHDNLCRFIFKSWAGDSHDNSSGEKGGDGGDTHFVDRSKDKEQERESVIEYAARTEF
ncbi:hypothetical protein CFIMG_007705RA00001 [Ceratocystis fimbriata CBS 114723]|uniref:Uncharacterized protein n=1 Tax=Ceratocystis fimbriata CBS 114723 TaxID=1035309 RepID=A0A2C5WTW6_9PEZI|nr:hypothetical protein CFIMG_007705RA00001 [Ceratocystis fimbriata CBS 114723]